MSDFVYRKVATRLWMDPEFLALDEGSKTVAMYLLTSPQTNACGYFVLSKGAAAEEIGTTPQTFDERFAVVCQTFGWRFDERTRVLWIPSWWRYNEPRNSNIMIGNLKALREVPANDLDAFFFSNLGDMKQNIRKTFKETAAERYPKRYPKQSPTQDQDQEQEQKQEQEQERRRQTRAPAREAPTEAAAELKSEEAKFFETVEAHFNRERGTARLIDAQDYQVVRRWRERGIPLDLIQREISGVFAKHRERGNGDLIQTLRYCAKAVEVAWAEIEQLQAPGERAAPAPDIDVAARLEAVAELLPADLPDRGRWAERIRSCTENAEDAEEQLAAIDSEILDEATEGLSEERASEIESRVDAAVRSLASRLPDDALRSERGRLFRQQLRALVGLPRLSLFAPAVEAAA